MRFHSGSAITRNSNRSLIKVYLILLLTMACASATRAEGSLKTIDNPGVRLLLLPDCLMKAEKPLRRFVGR